MSLFPVAAISTPTIVLLIVIAAMVVVLIVLTVVGNKEKKKADEAQAQLEEAAMPMSMLVIDKKKMRMNESGLPKMVIDNVPKRYRRNKVPIVKAKVGPKIMSFMCDEKLFDMVPVKKEIKAMVSGIYIISVKGMRGAVIAPPKKKTGFFSRFRKK